MTDPDKIREGMQKAREQGKQIGRPEREIDRETMYKIHNLRNLPGDAKKSFRDIADLMDIPVSTLCEKYKEYKEERDGDTA